MFAAQKFILDLSGQFKRPIQNLLEIIGNIDLRRIALRPGQTPATFLQIG